MSLNSRPDGAFVCYYAAAAAADAECACKNPTDKILQSQAYSLWHPFEYLQVTVTDAGKVIVHSSSRGRRIISYLTTNKSVSVLFVFDQFLKRFFNLYDFNLYVL